MVQAVGDGAGAGHESPDSSLVQSQSLELLRDGAGDDPASRRAEKDPLPLKERWRQKISSASRGRKSLWAQEPSPTRSKSLPLLHSRPTTGPS